MAAAASTQKKRKVKGLLLTDTLGKGTFGYVKLGIKEETGQQFALKFLMKNNRRFKVDQVKTEIACMQKVKHPNVVQLLYADMNCKYPNSEGGMDNVVLMILEYAPGGDLYDILFYSGKLNEQITKTYFLQLAKGVEALHKAGITHRDLKANNILLDHKFRLKITDFGLSHVHEGGDIASNRMKTTWVGTRGYQAPELVLNRPFSYKVDIFAMGVVVFTLLCGHQPFKSAAASDPWYKCIAAGKPKKFWSAHSNDKLSVNCMNIIEKMIAYQPKERVEISELYGHKWLKESGDGALLSDEALFEQMRTLHKVATQKKLKDPKRLKRIEQSQVKNEKTANSRGELDNEIAKAKVPKAPRIIPARGCWVIQDKVDAKLFMSHIQEMIKAKAGTCKFLAQDYKLVGQMKFASDNKDFTMGLSFKLFEHPSLANRLICHMEYDSGDDSQDVILGDVLAAYEEIFPEASKNFEGAYVPDFDDKLFQYDSKMFGEAIAETGEEEVAAAS